MSTYERLSRLSLLHLIDHGALLHEALNENDEQKQAQRQAYLRRLSREELNHEESRLLMLEGRVEEAIAYCKPELAMALFNNIEDPQQRQTVMDRALLRTACTGNDTVARFLLKAGANTDARDQHR